MDKDGQKVQTSGSKISKYWGCDAQNSDCKQNEIETFTSGKKMCELFRIWVGKSVRISLQLASLRPIKDFSSLRLFH